MSQVSVPSSPHLNSTERFSSGKTREVIIIDSDDSQAAAAPSVREAWCGGTLVVEILENTPKRSLLPVRAAAHHKKEIVVLSSSSSEGSSNEGEKPLMDSSRKRLLETTPTKGALLASKEIKLSDSPTIRSSSPSYRGSPRTTLPDGLRMNTSSNAGGPFGRRRKRIPHRTIPLSSDLARRSLNSVCSSPTPSSSSGGHTPPPPHHQFYSHAVSPERVEEWLCSSPAPSDRTPPLSRGHNGTFQSLSKRTLSERIGPELFSSSAVNGHSSGPSTPRRSNHDVCTTAHRDIGSKRKLRLSVSPLHSDSEGEAVAQPPARKKRKVAQHLVTNVSGTVTNHTSSSSRVRGYSSSDATPPLSPQIAATPIKLCGAVSMMGRGSGVSRPHSLQTTPLNDKNNSVFERNGDRQTAKKRKMSLSYSAKKKRQRLALMSTSSSDDMSSSQSDTGAGVSPPPMVVGNHTPLSQPASSSKTKSHTPLSQPASSSKTKSHTPLSQPASSSKMTSHTSLSQLANSNKLKFQPASSNKLNSHTPLSKPASNSKMKFQPASSSKVNSLSQPASSSKVKSHTSVSKPKLTPLSSEKRGGIAAPHTAAGSSKCLVQPPHKGWTQAGGTSSKHSTGEHTHKKHRVPKSPCLPLKCKSPSQPPNSKTHAPPNASHSSVNSESKGLPKRRKTVEQVPSSQRETSQHSGESSHKVTQDDRKKLNSRALSCPQISPTLKRSPNASQPRTSVLPSPHSPRPYEAHSADRKPKGGSAGHSSRGVIATPSANSECPSPSLARSLSEGKKAPLKEASFKHKDSSSSSKSHGGPSSTGTAKKGHTHTKNKVSFKDTSPTTSKKKDTPSHTSCKRTVSPTSCKKVFKHVSPTNTNNLFDFVSPIRTKKPVSPTTKKSPKVHPSVNRSSTSGRESSTHTPSHSLTQSSLTSQYTSPSTIVPSNDTQTNTHTSLREDVPALAPVPSLSSHEPMDISSEPPPAQTHPQSTAEYANSLPGPSGCSNVSPEFSDAGAPLLSVSPPPQAHCIASSVSVDYLINWRVSQCSCGLPATSLSGRGGGGEFDKFSQGHLDNFAESFTNSGYSLNNYLQVCERLLAHGFYMPSQKLSQVLEIMQNCKDEHFLKRMHSLLLQDLTTRREVGLDKRQVWDVMESCLEKLHTSKDDLSSAIILSYLFEALLKDLLSHSADPSASLVERVLSLQGNYSRTRKLLDFSLSLPGSLLLSLLSLPLLTCHERDRKDAATKLARDIVVRLDSLSSTQAKCDFLEGIPSNYLREKVIDLYLEREFPLLHTHAQSQSVCTDSISLAKISTVHFKRTPYHRDRTPHSLSFFLRLLAMLLQSHLLTLNCEPLVSFLPSSPPLPAGSQFLVSPSPLLSGKEVQLAMRDLQQSVNGLVDGLMSDGVFCVEMTDPLNWFHFELLTSITSS